jgi:hypothetical protein
MITPIHYVSSFEVEYISVLAPKFEVAQEHNKDYLKVMFTKLIQARIQDKHGL